MIMYCFEIFFENHLTIFYEMCEKLSFLLSNKKTQLHVNCDEKSNCSILFMF